MVHKLTWCLDVVQGGYLIYKCVLVLIFFYTQIDPLIEFLILTWETKTEKFEVLLFTKLLKKKLVCPRKKKWRKVTVLRNSSMAMVNSMLLGSPTSQRMSSLLRLENPTPSSPSWVLRAVVISLRIYVLQYISTLFHLVSWFAYQLWQGRALWWTIFSTPTSRRWMAKREGTFVLDPTQLIFNINYKYIFSSLVPPIHQVICILCIQVYVSCNISIHFDQEANNIGHLDSQVRRH